MLPSVNNNNQRESTSDHAPSSSNSSRELQSSSQQHDDDNKEEDSNERNESSDELISTPSSSSSSLTKLTTAPEAAAANGKQTTTTLSSSSPVSTTTTTTNTNTNTNIAGCARDSSEKNITNNDTHSGRVVVEGRDNGTDSPPTTHITSTTAADNRASSSENFEDSHIIPGVEHVFFEEELDKMEQASNTNQQIIVLAADGSSHSELAFKFYKENVDRPGYYLHVVHHSDVWSDYAPGEDGPSVDHCKELVEKAKGVVDTVSEKYKKLMQENNIQGETVVLHGKDAWHDIIQHQEQTKAMMIVMGTRGHGALSRTFRGSVSDSVVHHANVPVLVCCHPKDHH